MGRSRVFPDLVGEGGFLSAVCEVQAATLYRYYESMILHGRKDQSWLFLTDLDLDMRSVFCPES